MKCPPKHSNSRVRVGVVDERARPRAEAAVLKGRGFQPRRPGVVMACDPEPRPSRPHREGRGRRTLFSLHVPMRKQEDALVFFTYFE